MPLIATVLNPGSTDPQVGELHKQLTELGAVIPPAEQTANRFGDSTKIAVQDFQERYGLPASGILDNSTARLMHAASAFASPGGREALRTALREVVPLADSSNPQELYQLARFAIIAGDYQTAHSIAQLVPNHADIKGVIEPIVQQPDPQPRPPDLPYPENFYTYRHDLYPPDVLDRVQQLVKEVGEPPRDTNQANGPDLGPDAVRGRILIQVAASWFEAIKQWQKGNEQLNHRQYAAAQAAYDACQAAACDYFSKFYNIDLGAGALTDRLSNLIKHLDKNRDLWKLVWSNIIWRRGLLTLEELQDWDFSENPFRLSNLLVPRSHDPAPVAGVFPPPLLPPPPDFGLGFIQRYLHRGEVVDPSSADRQKVLETPLITIAFVLAPLARAEANRARRQYDAAIRDLRWVLDSVIIGKIFPTPQNPGPIRNVLARLACEFIELPFARLLLAETMLDKADAEYKARIPAEPAPAPDVSVFQGLKAAQTYLAIKDEFSKNEPPYVAQVDAGREQLTEEIEQRLAANDTSSREFQLLGKDIYLPILKSFSAALPGLDRRAKAHEPLLQFTIPTGQVMRETNPRVYAAVLTATARLEQLRAGFNYLGYLDSYVPPWRFQFLLERSRYFAEHAKNAQRESVAEFRMT